MKGETSNKEQHAGRRKFWSSRLKLLRLQLQFSTTDSATSTRQSGDWLHTREKVSKISKDNRPEQNQSVSKSGSEDVELI